MLKAQTDMIEDRVAEVVDLNFYSTQLQIPFSSKREALRHFVSTGQSLNAMPHPLFHTQWFKWQNPDHVKQDSVLHDFVIKSKKRIVDPSPMLDMTRIMQKLGTNDPVHALTAATDQQWGAVDGVYHNYYDLVESQKSMRNSITMKVLRSLPPQSLRKRRKNLLWVQIGPDSEFVKWFKPELSRNWDLLVNWYSPDAIDNSLGEIAIHQRGTKFTAVAEVWNAQPDIFEDYHNVMFFDDDLIIDHENVDQIFETAERHQLDVFQPALTKNSHGVWPVFRQKSKHASCRKTNGVEIMMPGFSKKAIWQILPLFNYSISGFGLDLLIAKIVRERNFKCGVIDGFPVFHSKEINQVSGAYYNFLRQFGINSKAELWYLVEAFSLELNFYEV